MLAKDIKVKMAEETKGGDSRASDGFNLDGILGELGSFGKYQLVLLLLLSFRDSFLAMCNFNYVFTAADVAHRCVVPECEDLDSSFNSSWASFALPTEGAAVCRRLAPVPAQLNDSWRTCSAAHFYSDRTIHCERLVYEDYNSIVAEFDLGCEPWKRTLIGTVHNLGLVFSYIISGIISDRYGRKVIIVATPLVVGVAGLVKSFSVNYWMLIVLEFLETALGYGNASMVLSLESVSHKRRVMFSCMSDILSSFGTAFFGLIAWKVPYWRYLMRAIYAPLLVVVFYIFLIDEGVRWLLAHNKRVEAVRVLNKVAKINNITLSHKAKEMLDKIAEEKSRVDEPLSNQKQETPHIVKVLRSKTILLRVCLMAACFLCGSFVYSGTIINSTNISGNKYLNFAAMQLVAIPTRVITAYTLTRFGRKAPISVSYCFCAVFFIAAACGPHLMGSSSLLFYLMGMMGSCYGMFALSVVAMEVFPTTSRNSLTNLATTVGRVGGVLAPQTPLLEKYMSGLASITFGAVSLGPALLALLLPDTSRAALPDDIAAAETIDRRVDSDDDTSITTDDLPCKEKPTSLEKAFSEMRHQEA